MTLGSKAIDNFSTERVMVRIALKEKGMGVTVQAWADDGFWSRASPVMGALAASGLCIVRRQLMWQQEGNGP